MNGLLSHISNSCGFTLNKYEPVSGGDINESFCLFTNDNCYFLKTNNANRYPDMFALEADGLNALRQNTTLQVPVVIKHGIFNNQQWLVLEWMEKGSATIHSMKNFGAALAHMHKLPQKEFGWHIDNYIGSLQQINTKHSTWSEFYIQCRIQPLVKILFNQGSFSSNDIAHADSFSKKIAALFPEEPAALLHGDLWGGNYMINKEGNAAIFDPAVYCGHREMDIGMTKLFGGFDNTFYDTYNNTYPLAKGWQQRLPYTQLFPLLVHAVLFGGHYINQCRSILASF
ncbi:MAG: fructosamine kinase family protein [Chitinophagaceae bacterium]